DAGIADGHGAAEIARVEILFVRDLRRRIDLGKRAEEAELRAVFAVLPVPAVFSADADVHVTHGHVPAVVALPPRYELGLCMSIPHQLAGRIELARDANLPITRRRNFCRFWHCSSPWVC